MIAVGTQRQESLLRERECLVVLSDDVIGAWMDAHSAP